MGPYDPLPTGEALRDYWTRELDIAAGEFLRVTCENGGRAAIRASDNLF